MIQVTLVVRCGVEERGVEQGVVGLVPFVGAGRPVAVAEFESGAQVPPRPYPVAQFEPVLLGFLGGGVLALDPLVGVAEIEPSAAGYW